MYICEYTFACVYVHICIYVHVYIYINLHARLSPHPNQLRMEGNGQKSFANIGLLPLL